MANWDWNTADGTTGTVRDLDNGRFNTTVNGQVVTTYDAGDMSADMANIIAGWSPERQMQWSQGLVGTQMAHPNGNPLTADKGWSMPSLSSIKTGVDIVSGLQGLYYGRKNYNMNRTNINNSVHMNQANLDNSVQAFNNRLTDKAYSKAWALGLKGDAVDKYIKTYTDKWKAHSAKLNTV